jgi:serine/threonine-protein kinase
VTVPDVRGRTLAQAERQIERVGLEIERGSTFAHPTVPRGAVLAQSPLPGQETSRGDAVRVTVSAGPDQRPVPDISGLSGDQARRVLANTGYQVHVEIVSDARPAGRVVAVQPAAGTVLRVPGRVLLQLSAGPPPPPPSVVGAASLPAPMEPSEPDPEPDPEVPDTVVSPRPPDPRP